MYTSTARSTSSGLGGMTGTTCMESPFQTGLTTGVQSSPPPRVTQRNSVDCDRAYNMGRMPSPLTKKLTLNDLRAARRDGAKVAMLTCYDYTTARLMHEAGV